ncbi:hypothetical protein [Frondihabitans australicus]|uniref:DNA modification methylase n=1 Tax=Frondihabitans australicus TaxID=386892 RepID=A0A495IH89_9MICO|nr:hypothetical protein [Frondihabitans australicus]RKR75357.1 hypothetical protein C8E83_2503 [Frondihabitans australicus]
MKLRTTASIALAGAVIALTAGCNFISPQTTTEQYDASDGFSTNVGSLDVRNAIVFTDDAGKLASLSVTLINNSSSAKNVVFQYDAKGGVKKTVDVVVPADGTISRGTSESDPQLLLTNAKAKPGALLKVFIQYGNQSGKNLDVPVLNGAFKEYATLQPTPTTTTVPTAPSTISPTDSANAPLG